MSPFSGGFVNFNEPPNPIVKQEPLDDIFNVPPILELHPLTSTFAKPAPLTDRMLFGKHVSGKRANGMLVRCRLYCSHCKNYFYAKPTKRVRFYVLNHQCSGDARKQYVVG